MNELYKLLDKTIEYLDYLSGEKAKEIKEELINYLESKNNYKLNTINVYDFVGTKDTLNSIVANNEVFDSIMLKHYINENTKDAKTLANMLDGIQCDLKYINWEVVKDYNNYLLIKAKHKTDKSCIYIEVIK